MSLPEEPEAWLEREDQQQHALEGSCSIGRATLNTLVVDSAKVSRLHAFAEGWIDYRSLDLDPRFDAVRSNAQYQEIFGSMVTRVASLRAARSPAKVTQK